MYWLLNPRLWIAAALAALLAFTHFTVYRLGKSAVRAEWNEEKAAQAAFLLEQEKSFRKKEQALVVQRQQAEKRYVEEKRKAATAALAAESALDGLRNELAARDRDLASADSAASSRANGGAGLERELLGSCATALTELAAEADRLEARVVGLQAYVKQVCQKQ
jgi:hypothetical protein